jgi:hypothetical protein
MLKMRYVENARMWAGNLHIFGSISYKPKTALKKIKVI